MHETQKIKIYLQEKEAIEAFINIKKHIYQNPRFHCGFKRVDNFKESIIHARL